MTYGSRDSPPPSLPPFRKNGKKETRGEERKRQEWEEGGGKGGERHTQWRLGRDDRGYCIVFSFGTNDLPCFPLYCRELLQPPQKHVRGCESHRESATEGRGWRRERETGGRRTEREEEEEEWSGKASRTIWEVLHIYGLLVRARKQISSKSW